MFLSDERSDCVNLQSLYFKSKWHNQIVRHTFVSSIDSKIMISRLYFQNKQLIKSTCCSWFHFQVMNIKKSWKAVHHQDMEEQMMVDSREMHYSTSSDKLSKKPVKGKAVG